MPRVLRRFLEIFADELKMDTVVCVCVCARSVSVCVALSLRVHAQPWEYLNSLIHMLCVVTGD